MSNVLRKYQRGGDDFFIRKGTDEDKESVNALAKNSPAKSIHSFAYVWESWGNWESNPPFLLFHGDKLIGFHAATFLKMGYVNSYYLAINPEYKGRKLGGDLMEVVLEEAQDRGITRYTNKAKPKFDGYPFYTGMGLEPIGMQGEDAVFDFPIQGITTIPQLIEECKKEGFYTDPPIPLRRLKKYKKDLDECYLPDGVFDRVVEYDPILSGLT